MCINQRYFGLLIVTAVILLDITQIAYVLTSELNDGRSSSSLLKTLYGLKQGNAVHVDGFDEDICGRTPVFTENLPEAWTRAYCRPSDKKKKLMSALSGRTSRSERRRGQTRMSHGYRARPGEYPSYVELEYEGYQSDSICGGVLVGRDLVLSTASCVPSGIRGGTAKMGLYNTTMKEQVREIKVKSLCTMKEYDGHPFTPEYDVVLLQLKSLVQYSDYIQPVCLAMRGWHRPEATCVAVGNGYMKNSGKRARNLIGVPMRRDCDFTYDLSLKSRSCYTSVDFTLQGSPCEGDWGGPMYCTDRCNFTADTQAGFRRQYLVGLASFGPIHGCIHGKTQNVFYTDIFKLKEQIETLFSSCYTGRLSGRPMNQVQLKHLQLDK